MRKYTKNFVILFIVMSGLIAFSPFMFQFNPIFGFIGFMLILFSFFVVLIIVGIRHYSDNRKKVFKETGMSYMGRKYDDTILKDKLERWSDYEYELSGNKKYVHVNKSIYDLEKKVIKLYTKDKISDALDLIQQIFLIVNENYDDSHPFFALTMTNLGRLYQ